MKAAGWWRRVPLAGWIVPGVVAIHLWFFWAVSDKHFLPKARYVPPPPTPNFGTGEHRSVDPQTGETTTERQFQVSTVLATPAPRRSPTAAPK